MVMWDTMEYTDGGRTKHGGGSPGNIAQRDLSNIASRGMNIHKSQLSSGSLGARVLTHSHIYIYIHSTMWGHQMIAKLVVVFFFLVSSMACHHESYIASCSGPMYIYTYTHTHTHIHIHIYIYSPIILFPLYSLLNQVFMGGCSILPSFLSIACCITSRRCNHRARSGGSLVVSRSHSSHCRTGLLAALAHPRRNRLCVDSEPSLGSGWWIPWSIIVVNNNGQ